MKVLLLVVYGAAAFACGVYSLSKKAPEGHRLVALVVAVVAALAIWRMR